MMAHRSGIRQLGLILALLAYACNRMPDPDTARPAARLPHIDPDYAFVTIPPNIAPLNFRIQENGRHHAVRITPSTGEAVWIRARRGTVRLDPAGWRRMLAANRGQQLAYDIFVQDDEGNWKQYERIVNRVADEPIDPYIAFRQLVPNPLMSTIRGIYQRHLESFEREAILTLRTGTLDCMNCHTFHNYDPDRFLFHVRGRHAGMMLVIDGKARKIETRQDPMFRPLAYASWHPDGNHIAATINMYASHFQAGPHQVHFQAVEKRGDLVVYSVETNQISSTEAVFGQEYIETHPCWSHDGRYIYYVRCKDRPLVSHEDMDAFKFDLMRVPFCTDTGKWGTPEIVVEYSRLGKSCAFPRPSACGRYILHILVDRGTYPIHRTSSNLHLLDLETGEHTRLDAASSDLAESYPRWSSNGRWFSFVSTRRDGMSALPYFAYFDTAGHAHKAFLLPQEDPAFYDTFTDTYNVLELIGGKVDKDAFRLARAVQQPARQASFPDPPQVDAYTGATWRQVWTEMQQLLEQERGQPAREETDTP